MCIVIDTNVLPSVFKKSSSDHADFKPVLDWIINGKGKVIFGGTKYIKELNKYITLFNQLKIAGKAIIIPANEVDAEEINVSKMLSHADFDDQHIVGLLRISKCKLICSLDSRAYPFFRHSIFFKPAANKPSIYSSITNLSLLCDQYIAEICKPCSATTNRQKDQIGKL